MCVREERFESYFLCVCVSMSCVLVSLSVSTSLALSCELRGPRLTSAHPSNYVLGHKTFLHKGSRDESGGGSWYKFTQVVLQPGGCRWVKEGRWRMALQTQPSTHPDDGEPEGRVQPDISTDRRYFCLGSGG